MDINLQIQNSLSSIPNNALPKSPTNNLDISAATYLGGAEDDFTDAVDISLDGNFVIVGGSLKNAKLAGKEAELLGGGDGTIVRYDSQTNQAVATTRLPGRVLDLEVSNNGDIAVAYEGGIAVLNADATEVKWSKFLTDVSRIAISDTGKVGVVRDIKGADRAYLFNSNGEQLQEWSTKSKRHFNDIAVTDQNGGMVVTTGFEQKTSILQVAFTRAWSYEGENLWKNYDFDDEDIYKENLLADTRGQRVAFGRDGQLYAAYYVNGGTGFSIFYRDPYDVTEKLTDQRKIETDQYNSPSNVNSIQLLWYGRYDLKNGDLIKGQSLLGRGNDGKGNSVNAESITATKDGTVIIAGGAAARIANRDEQTIEGQGVSEYTPYDGHIAIISPDLTERLSWTPISDSNGGVVAAFRDGKIAAVTTTDFEGSQITHNAIQESAGGKKDGYLLVVGGHDALPKTVPMTPEDNLPTGNNLPNIDPKEIEPKEVDISVPVIETDTGSDRIPTVDTREVDISIPVIETNIGSDNLPNVDTREVDISIPVIETNTGSDNLLNVGTREVDISIPVIETDTGSDRIPTVDTKEVNISIPVIETNTGSNNLPNVDTKEVDISIPVIETNTGSNNLPNVDTKEVDISVPIIETNTGSDNLPNVDTKEVDISVPVLEGGSKNPHSIFPRGLIDLSKIDLHQNNQADNRFAGKFSEIRLQGGHKDSINYDVIANINPTVGDFLTDKLINPEKEDYIQAALNQHRQDLELRFNRRNLTDRFIGKTMGLPFFTNDMVEELMEQQINNQNKSFPRINSNFLDSEFLDSEFLDSEFLGMSTDNSINEDIPQLGKQIHFGDAFCGGNNNFDNIWTYLG